MGLHRKLETKADFEQLYTKEDPWEIRTRSKGFVRRICKILGRLIPSLKNRRILLDCACGEGIITSFLDGQFDLVIGMDISRKALSRAKKAAKNCAFIEGDIRYLPFKKRSVDCITCFETLQYLKTSYEKALHEFHRVSRDDGHIIMSIEVAKGYLIYNPFLINYQKYFKETKIIVLQTTLTKFTPNLVPDFIQAIATAFTKFLPQKILIFGYKRALMGR